MEQIKSGLKIRLKKIKKYIYTTTGSEPLDLERKTQEGIVTQKLQPE